MQRYVCQPLYYINLQVPIDSLKYTNVEFYVHSSFWFGLVFPILVPNLVLFLPTVSVFNTFASSRAGRQPVSVMQPRWSGADTHSAGWQFASVLETKIELKAAFPLLPGETREVYRRPFNSTKHLKKLYVVEISSIDQSSLKQHLITCSSTLIVFCYMQLNVLGAKRRFIFTRVIATGKKYQKSSR